MPSLYSWTHVSFWGMTVTIADGGFSVPGLGVSSGLAKILFSDGKPIAGDFGPRRISARWSRSRSTGRAHAPEDSAGIRIRGDILFAFDNYRLKPTQQTHQLLWGVMQGMEKSWTEDHRWLIRGHTDSIGSRAYNRTLAKRRAESVAGPDWTWGPAGNLTPALSRD